MTRSPRPSKNDRARSMIAWPRRDEPGNDRALTCEGRSILAGNRIVAGLHQPERIDAERADDARVQASKVEREDVAIEAGCRIEDVAAGARHHLDVDADVVRHD